MSIYLSYFSDLFLESAPWLLLGFFIAGLIHVFIPTEQMNKHLGGKGLWTTIKAALIGAPLPLCSCGVVPAALGLRRSGASKNSTVSFLVATPETGVDSLSVTYALMGPLMTIMRPIAAVTSAIVAGVLVGQEQKEVPAQKTNVKKCCASKKNNTSAPQSIGEKIFTGLKFSCVSMLDDISKWLIVGLLFAAAVQTFVPDTFFTEWGNSWLAFAVMAAIGVPMYICATASTPIAAGFLFSGVSPGAVLVFMLAGPATNLGTIAIIRKELGQRALTAYLGGVVATSFAFGYITNLLAAQWPINNTVMAHQHSSTALIYQASAVVLAVLLLVSFYRQIRRKITADKLPST
ncbi:permease [Endozoicomonas sp. (ex Bugula neritina AB1)]|nr:permease [Endozoicomonas sp. (ex Bugula neritina AB1)]